MWTVVAEQLNPLGQALRDDIFYAFLPLYHMNAQCLATITVLPHGGVVKEIWANEGEIVSPEDVLMVVV